MIEEHASYPLDLVIKRISKPQTHDPRIQTVVIINCNPNKRPWERRIQRNYLVSHDGTSRTVCERKGLIVPIEDFSMGWRLDLSVDYSARCAASDANKLAHALNSETSPQERLDQYIKEWIDDFASANGGTATFIRNYFELSTGIDRHLVARAKSVAGLDLRTGVKLRNEDLLDTYMLNTLSVPIFLLDYPKQILLTISNAPLVIHPDPKDAILAHVRFDGLRELPKILSKRIMQFASENLTLDQFRGLKLEVRTKIIQELNILLREYGRKMLAVELSSDTPLPQLPPAWSLDYPFTFKVPDYPADVKMTSTGAITLHDGSVFASISKFSLDQWKADIVPAIVRRVLANMRYVDLFKDLESKKVEIRSEVDKEAKKIGYALSHLDIETDLPFEIVKRPFEFSTNDDYPTIEHELRVKVSTTIKVRIPDLTKITSDLNQSKDIKKRMMEEVSDKIKTMIRERSPENIYMYFDKNQAVGQSGGGSETVIPPLKEALAHAIRALLDEEFGAEVLALDCRRDGELMDILRDLRATTRPLEVFLTRARIKVSLKYYIHTVVDRRWHRFQATRPTAAILTENISDFLGQYFSDIDPSDFRSRTNGDWLAQINTDTRGLAAWIEQKYGLQVGVEHWTRSLTAGEEQQIQTQNSAEMGLERDHNLEMADWFETKETARTSKRQRRESLLAQQAELLKKIKDLDPMDSHDAAERKQRLDELGKVEEELGDVGEALMPSVLRRASSQLERNLGRALEKTVGTQNRLLPDSTGKASALGADSASSDSSSEESSLAKAQSHGA